jgi:hypothetical protein
MFPARASLAIHKTLNANTVHRDALVGGGYSEKSSGVSPSHGPAGYDLIIIILLDRIVNVDV